ncbi:hypothetical protein TWF225_008188 [Orbilia oligospora]|nr:hypothetical protein TWF225_008188 [Orbilia oligospora]KAF3246442.1 hypothetical protein TWF128_008906 [Orbilia oligospora]KAF3268902.1 hypothetical protein TWF217_010190 [Orbilia oligospora]KAF3292805.1 hypothetical protein TWF132_005174 [Orbilia oligospora]
MGLLRTTQDQTPDKSSHNLSRFFYGANVIYTEFSGSYMRYAPPSPPPTTAQIVDCGSVYINFKIPEVLGDIIATSIHTNARRMGRGNGINPHQIQLAIL